MTRKFVKIPMELVISFGQMEDKQIGELIRNVMNKLDGKSIVKVEGESARLLLPVILAANSITK